MYKYYVHCNVHLFNLRTKWLPVNISVKDGVLVIKRSAPPSMPISSATAVPPDTPPLHEFRLHHNHLVTPPQLRPYNRKTKLHQIKLRQTQVSGREERERERGEGGRERRRVEGKRERERGGGGEGESE